MGGKDLLAAVLVVVCFGGSVEAQRRDRTPPHRVEKNVVYGMYSGLALLMDVHHPVEPNGYGVIHVSGSGWTAPLGMGARQLKHSVHVQLEAWPLVEAGYTVFTINHRAAPRFHYPAPVEDARRAVRFIRANAERFGIDPGRLGAIGGSSGGHLVSMLGLEDGSGDPDAYDPVDRLSAKVQCVVARAVPARQAELTNLLLLGYRVMGRYDEQSEEKRVGRLAYPLAHVSSDDPPVLLLHGSDDPIVPVGDARVLADALEAVGVPVKLIVVEGAGHGPNIRGNGTTASEVYATAVEWMDTHLKRQP